ncbi:MAG: serine/threonine protein kinase [Acidobacteria bacterium]|nr:serine/threonine protein kinase [Acidobacteriota bacterium]
MRSLKDLLGLTLDGKYLIEKMLGQGGMGAVFLATHLGTERTVALKVIAPEFMANEEFIERFRREAKAAGRLRHPNIVNVTDFGFTLVGTTQIAYLVMEYLDGSTLTEVLNFKHQLPVNVVVDVVEQICLAIERAHQYGIVHRDLKPDNIWLEPDGRDGYNVKVLDFGIAKLRGAPADNMLPGSTLPLAQLEIRDSTTFPNVTEEVSEAATFIKPTVQPVDAGGVVTERQLASAQTEAATMMQPAPAELSSSPLSFDSEGSTKIQPTGGSGTHGYASGSGARSSGSLLSTRHTGDSQITRLGSVMGTPMYMSPEQCRGEEVDTRSDLYSLGVIVYQMLTGEPPFRGDTSQLLVKHQTEPPPPFPKKPKVPKRIAKLVLSAMAKEPTQRPQSATAFASAFRARTEGFWSFVSQGVSLYNQYFRTFLWISVISHAPMILVGFLYLVFNINRWATMGPDAVKESKFFELLLGVGGIIHSFISCLFAPIVVQLLAVQVKKVSLRPLLMVLKKNIKPLLKTVVWYMGAMTLAGCLCFFPVLWAMVTFSFTIPVFLIEGYSGLAALKRSKELVNRLWFTVAGVMIVNALIAGFLLPAIGNQLAHSVIKVSPHYQEVYNQAVLPFFQTISSLFVSPIPQIASLIAYVRARQAGGETMKEISEQCRSRWEEVKNEE